jgi:mono/diheme cytochrome c family protein
MIGHRTPRACREARALIAVAALLCSEALCAQSANTTELAARGRQIYALSCSRCHGPNMVSVGTSAYDLRRFPLDQKDRFVNSVTKGLRVMPAWGGLLSPEQIEALWAYVASAPRP